MSEPTYPNVRCAHGAHPDEPGYVICRHIVLEGAEPASIELATREHLGVVLCATPPHFGRDLMVVCAACARGHKWLRT